MKQLTVNGVRLNFWDEGQGAPLLLVHGFPLNHAMWREQLPALAVRRRVIAPDLRGFGGSEVTGAAVVSMDQFADDCAALLDELGIREPITFCGLSMGGYIGWSFVRRHGQRLARLILCDTRAAADTPEAAANRRKVADQVSAEGTQSLVRAMLPKLLARGTIENQPAVVEFLKEMMSASAPTGVAAAQRGMAERADARELLSTIEIPALLIVGIEDAISTADEMRGMAEAMPQAGLVIVQDAGHMAPLENPAIVNRAIEDFLGD